MSPQVLINCTILADHLGQNKKKLHCSLLLSEFSPIFFIYLIDNILWLKVVEHTTEIDKINYKMYVFNQWRGCKSKT